MLTTITDMYHSFLDGIKKESTTTVTPSRFNRMINTAQLLWEMVNIKDVEREQFDIDRFRNILVSEEVPVSTTANMFPLSSAYLRLLSTQFKVQWNSTSCYDGISEFLPGNYLKTNNISVSKVNPYRRTNQNRLHYRQIEQNIEFIENPHCTPIICKIEYLRYAQDMLFVAVGSTSNVDCELPITARQEIVDIAVRIHLERVLDPRYKSYLNEYVINANVK